MTRKHRRALAPSPALVVAGAALLVALGGTALAAPQVKPPAWKANVTAVKEEFSVSNEGILRGKAQCPPGTQVFSGGYAVSGQHARIVLAAPSRSSRSYLVYAFEPPVNIATGVGKETATITVIALCAPLNAPIVLG